MKTVKFKGDHDAVYLVAARIVGFSASPTSGSLTCIITDERDKSTWHVNDTPEEVAAILDAVPDAPAIDMDAYMEKFWNMPFPDVAPVAGRRVAKPVEDKPCKYKFSKGVDSTPDDVTHATAGITVTSKADPCDHINAIEIYQADTPDGSSLERTQELRDFVLAKLNEES